MLASRWISAHSCPRFVSSAVGSTLLAPSSLAAEAEAAENAEPRAVEASEAQAVTGQ